MIFLIILMIALIIIGFLICVAGLKIAALIFRTPLSRRVILVLASCSLGLGALSEVFGFAYTFFGSPLYQVLQFSVGLATWVIIAAVLKSTLHVRVLRAIGMCAVALILSLVMSAGVAFSVRTFAYQAFKIPSSGMEPALLVGDYLLVNKFLYKFVPPARGDIVVFEYPPDRSKDFIKRVVALGGDTVEIRDKKLLVNNAPFPHDPGVYAEPNILPASVTSRDNIGPMKVPQGSLFVMGDNRDRSLDSRFWGFVELPEVEGKAFVIYWSVEGQNKHIRSERIGMRIH